MWARVVERTVTNGADWMISRSTNSLQRVRSIFTPMSDQSPATPPTAAAGNGADAGPIGSNVLNAPDNLRSLNSRLLIFLSFCSLLIGGVWFGICVSLYVVGADYHVMYVMYESRWLPITVLFSGLASAMLAVWKKETFYIACGFTALYSCASCVVSVVVYSLDFRKALLQSHPTTTKFVSGQPRKKYLQLCSCMIIAALLGLSLSIMTLTKLWQIASWYYAKLALHRRQRAYLILSALVQLPLIWFSIYVTSHVISLPFSYVHQYMIQELLCALTLKSIVILQATHYLRANRLTLKLLLILNGCQTVQEVFYTWNSYYISLYIHSSKAKLALGADADQYLMSANFVGHFARMCIAAYTTYQISIWLRAPFVNAYCRVDLERRARQAMVVLAALALLLAAGHVVMDVLYTVTAHIYRTLIAFTGISVFYLSLIGVSLALFVRSGHMLLLIIASVFMLLLSAVSVHALYIYVDTSYHTALLGHLETMGKDKRQSSYMHFAEAFLAMCALLLCVIGGVFIFRLLHIDSLHDRRDGRLKKPLLSVFALGVIQLELAAVNAALIVSVRDDSKVFQSMLAYGVLDSISMFVLCLTQIYVCRPSNSHVSYGLTALLLFLICEALTTYNYLSTKTTYVQLLIVFSHVFASNPAAKQALMVFFPADEVGLLVAAHVVQLVQWILTVISLVLTALALEKLHEQRKELADAAASAPTTRQRAAIAATDASAGGVVRTVAALPAVSYTVSRNDTGHQRPQRDLRERGVCVSNGASATPLSYDNPLYNEDRPTVLNSAQRKRSVDRVATPKQDLERGELLPQEQPPPLDPSPPPYPDSVAEGNQERLIGRNEDVKETEEA